MKQAVTIAVRKVEISETAAPGEPGPGEALVDIGAVGICGSDIGMWVGTDPYATFPIRQGHEFSGRIAAFGPGYAGDLVVGALCAVEPLLPDHTCIACLRGHANCCRNLRVFGAHLDGALTERLIVPVTNLYGADDLTPELAAFVEPVSIGLQMVTRSGLAEGDQAVIFGAGPIGQAVQVAASDIGARVVSVDVVPGRLERAIANGAEAAIDARAGDLRARVADWTAGEGPVVVFEATGVSSVFGDAIDIVAHSGTVVVAGTSNDDVAIASMALVRKEINVLGSRNNAGLYARAVDIVRRHRDRCESLITQRFGLDEVQRAMEFGDANPALANKMMVLVGA
jgi:threonine dehydrogenase-like Zn-dependent dehydrogenase